MKIIIKQDAASATAHVAAMVAAYVRSDPAPVLGLATGRTMEQVYTRLVALHVTDGLDLSRCTTFNLDEYCGLPPGSPNSYRAYMNHHLFDRTNIALEKTHLPSGDAQDCGATRAQYDAAIRSAGGIGLQLLGIGATGHIGFNEPLSSFASRTRVVTLDHGTLQQNAEMFDGIVADVPKQAVTMGVATILETRRAVLLATGLGKADIIARAVEGPVTAMISATALHFHPDCTIVLDEDAAAGLHGHYMERAADA
jgi:glucosamine-6-phosphate deaminase